MGYSAHLYIIIIIFQITYIISNNIFLQNIDAEWVVQLFVMNDIVTLSIQ